MRLAICLNNGLVGGGVGQSSFTAEVSTALDVAFI